MSFKNYTVTKTTRSSAGIETTSGPGGLVAGLFSRISDHEISGGFSESHKVLQTRTKRRFHGALHPFIGCTVQAVQPSVSILPQMGKDGN